MPHRRLHSDQRGVAAIEFALVASTLILLILGSVGVGLLWWTANGLQVAAALTARCAALGSCTDPAAFAVGIAEKWVGAGAISAADVSTTTNSACGGVSGNLFTKVTISSAMWASGVLPAPLSGITVRVSSCFPTSS